MIEHDRDFHRMFRMEASAEVLPGASSVVRSAWWLLAELGAKPDEDRVVWAEQRGVLSCDRNRTFAFAVGGRRSPGGALSAAARAALQERLRSIPGHSPLRGSIDGRRISSDEFARAAEQFLQAENAGDGETPASGGECLQIILVHWPELVCLTSCPAPAFVMHDGRLQRIGAQWPVAQPQRTTRCTSAIATGGFASSVLFDDPPDAGDTSPLTRVSLAFGDALLMCTSTVASYISEPRMARPLRSGISAKAASGELLHALECCGCQGEAAVLVARFYFRSERLNSLQSEPDGD